MAFQCGCRTTRPSPTRGTLVEVRGKLADPYGQTEVRPSASGITGLGTAMLPAPISIRAGEADEATEGRLVTVRGTVSTPPTRATSGDIAFSITGDDGATLRVQADASAGVDKASILKGTVATFTGVLGQRASRKGALDGYRLWLRDPADVHVLARPPAASGSPAPTRSADAANGAVSTIAAARIAEGRHVIVEGVLTSTGTCSMPRAAGPSWRTRRAPSRSTWRRPIQRSVRASASG